MSCRSACSLLPCRLASMCESEAEPTQHTGKERRHLRKPLIMPIFRQAADPSADRSRGHSELAKERLLSLGDLNRSRALLVIIRYMVDPRAHRVTAHEASVERLQQFGDRRHVLHTGVEPQIIRIRMPEIMPCACAVPRRFSWLEPIPHHVEHGCQIGSYKPLPTRLNRARNPLRITM